MTQDGRALKFNENHDAQGRFTSGDGHASNTDSNRSTPFLSPRWPDKGQSGLNVDEAVARLQSAADRNAGSQGQCARYVREAINAGGILIPDHPVAADRYGPYLERSGFSKLSPDPNPDYHAKAGDIVVFNRLKESGYGHIQMFNGRGWYSDFRQNGFWPSRDYRLGGKGYQIYRP